MKNDITKLFAAILTALCFASFNSGQTLISELKRPLFNSKEALKNVKAVKKIPRGFEENKGQVHKNVKYLSRGKDYNLFLTSEAAIYQIPNFGCESQNKENRKGKSKPCQAFSLKMKMLGANSKTEISGVDKLSAESNYLIGSDKSHWQSGIANFQGIRYKNIYNGIDVAFRGNEKNLEYDFYIAPKANTNLIRLNFEGAQNIKIDDNGDLVFKFQDIEIRHNAPVAYQIINGEKKQVSCSYKFVDKKSFSFEVGNYDNNKELIIDPEITYSTFLGGSDDDNASSVYVDNAGYVYITGGTRSSNFPTQNPYKNYAGGSIWTQDAFVTKLSPDGNQLIYSTYIGGTRDDYGADITVDQQGNAIIVGTTNSGDLPVANAYQSQQAVYGGAYAVPDVFITKLNAQGNSLVFSTYMGSDGYSPSERTVYSGYDYGRAIASDTAGNIYVGGEASPLFPGTKYIQLDDSISGFVAKFSPEGLLFYSSIASKNRITDLTIDSEGNVYAVDGDLIKLGRTGTISYTKHIPDAETLKAVTNIEDENTVIYLLGWNAGRFIDVVTRISSDGSILSTREYNPGSATNDISMAVDSAKRLYLTRSKLIRFFDSDQTTLLDTVFLNTQITDVKLTSNGENLYVAGTTDNRLNTTQGVVQSNFGGGYSDAYVTKIKVRNNNPVIFIPGTMGSELYRKNADGSAGEKYWVRVGSSHFYNPYLTLNEQSPFFVGNGFVAKDAVRKVTFSLTNVIGPDGNPVPVPIEASEIYYPFLKRIAEKGGFREYDLSRIPPTEGCDISQINSDPSQNPDLFVFPYDFRQDNAAVSAAKLKNFVECVQQFYPNKKINIVAHSQGGLVASRYIFQNSGNHHINKLITIATPFLGAPKAVYALEKGGDWSEDWGFSLGVMSPTEIKFLAEYFKSVHQLLPSRNYFGLMGNKVISENGDANGNNVFGEDYNYDQLVSLMNNDFPNTTPGDIGKRFHDPQSGENFNQDNWNNIQNDVEYHHIIGEQYSLNTPTSMTIDRSFRCGLVFCGNFNTINLYRGLGDKTVPTISASRIAYRLNPQTNQTEQINLNAPNSTRWYLYAQNEAEDESVEHNGLHKNSEVQDLTLYLLGAGPKPPGFERNVEELPNQNRPIVESNINQMKISPTESKVVSSNVATAASSQPPVTHPESYYFDVSGVNGVYLRDEDNKFTGQAEGLFFNQARGVTYDVIGEDQTSLVLSPSHNYTVRFQTGDQPFLIKFVKGIGNRSPNSLVVFQDVSLPQGTQVKLNVSPQGISNLLYDSNNDGTFDTEITPTVDTSGPNAKDIKPPTAVINVVQQGNSAIVTISAQDDLSGVKGIRYSLDGQTFNYYTSPFTLNYTQNPTIIYAFADDNVANRSSVFTKVFTFAPTSNPTLAVKPILECVTANSNGTLTAKFGYENYNSVPVIIPLGEKNKFTPVPKERGQITTFQSGRVVNAFSVIFTENNLKWHLTGPDGNQQNVSASKSSAKCQ